MICFCIVLLIICRYNQSMETRSEIIQERIKQMPEGAIFTFASLFDVSVAPQALAVVISRLVKRGLLQRLSKGRYGKPRQTRFGAVLPPDSQILESILRPDGDRVTGYVSGTAAYNRLGLTTQVPSEILIVGPTSSRQARFGKLRVRFVRSSLPITEETKELLPLLDALRDAKKIPDASVDEVVMKIRVKIGQFEMNEKNMLSETAISYAPRVRALLGAVFESLGEESLANAQKKTLNPISTYAIGVRKETLANAEKWNIR